MLIKYTGNVWLQTNFFGLFVCFTGNSGVQKYSAMYVFR